MKRKIAAAAAVVILAAAFTGCTSVSEPADTAAPAAETQETAAQTEETADTAAETEAEEAPAADAGNASCPLFSLTLPEGTSFEARSTDNSIAIYDKESVDAGFNGFVFEVSAFESPSDYAGGMSVKAGEMTISSTTYDIAWSTASEATYDVDTYSEEAPKNFTKLLNSREDIIASLTPADGGNFAYKGGTKGEDLYGDILAKHITALEECWEVSKLEEENMSTMYVLIAQDEGDPLERVGYTYFDLNADGIEELIIGEIADGDYKGIIYDLYTMQDRKPVHVVSGWDRNRYFALETGWLCREYSGGAALSGVSVYDIEPNTSNLLLQCAAKYDAYTNEEQPWFISYIDDAEDSDTWENVDEETYTSRLTSFGEYRRFDYTPIKEAK